MGVLYLVMFIALSQILPPSSVALGTVGNISAPLDKFENKRREEQYIPKVSLLSDIKGLASELNHS